MEKLRKFNGIFFPIRFIIVTFLDCPQRNILMNGNIITSQHWTPKSKENNEAAQTFLPILIASLESLPNKGILFEKTSFCVFYSAVCLHSCSFVCLISRNQIQWCRPPSSYKNSKWAILTAQKKYSTLQSSWELLCRKQKSWCKITYVFSFVLFCRYVTAQQVALHQTSNSPGGRWQRMDCWCPCLVHSYPLACNWMETSG